jgi:flagellar biosynthesis anti-sigma factor FlgM
MEIRNRAEELKALLGVTPASTAAQQIRGGSAATHGALEGDRATLSGVGTEVSLSAADDGVRADKVEEVRAALATGTYQVPASAVASKLVDAMLVGPSDE